MSTTTTNPTPTTPQPHTPTEPLTSTNTDTPNPEPGHIATGRPAARVDGPPRVLLVAGGWSLGGVVVSELTLMRRQGYRDARLFVRAGAGGVEQTASRWWSTLGVVEEVPDPADALALVDELLVFVLDAEPAVVAVLDRARELGVPTRLHHLGRYPFGPGPQRDRAARTAVGSAAVRRTELQWRIGRQRGGWGR